jgi:type I site-specific restriction endonuclease
MALLPYNKNNIYQPPLGYEPREWVSEAVRKFMVKCRAVDQHPLTFLLYAGTGAGKTNFAAQAAAECFSRELVRRLVYVCPNRVIKGSVRQSFSEFGFDLTDWNNRRHRDGEPIYCDGAVMTYQSLVQRPETQRRLCRLIPTLVVFDEIHHLGDKRAWAKAAREAFDGTRTLILGMTGTPYRSDNREMPFVTYLSCQEGLKKFQSDYSYSLGRAIVDGVCRRPKFDWCDAEVKVPVRGVERVVGFKEEVSDETANLRLSGAVCPGSESRKKILRHAVECCRGEGRKLIVFVGGDATSKTLATEDAEVLLPAELQELGVGRGEVMSVTCRDNDSAHKLRSFGRSSAWILATVNMVSEGADIPELSAALFLTSVTTKATTIQRIGRALRRSVQGGKAAPIFMFEDPRYCELGLEVEQEIDREFLIAQRHGREPHGDVGAWRPPQQRPQAVGLNSWPDGTTFNGKYYSQRQIEEARSYMAEENIPQTQEWLMMTLNMWERLRQSQNNHESTHA